MEIQWISENWLAKQIDKFSLMKITDPSYKSLKNEIEEAKNT
jgi:hypothetical protein